MAEQPSMVACPKCHCPLGHCTPTRLTLVGAQASIASRARIQCPMCGRSRSWSPVRVQESLKPTEGER